ncbi:MAG: efflux RND transporter permease subunit [Armatimonadota bacterium]
MWLTNLAIKRPVLIWMIFSALAVMGLLALFSMKRELEPKVEFPYVTVATVYVGAGPQEVETLISKPLEDAVNSVNGVKHVDSTSQEGMSLIFIEFKLGTNVDVAVNDVRSKVDRVRASLPEDAKTPTISKLDANSSPVFRFGMTGKREQRQLRYLAEEVVTNRLARVSGVAAVNVIGGAKREIKVILRPERLNATSLSPAYVVAAMKQQNLSVPGGRIEQSRHEYALRLFGEFRSLDQIRQLRIGLPGYAGQSVQLGDIATVLDAQEEKTQESRLNGRSTVTITVQKTSDANTAEVCDGVKQELEQLRRDLPKDVTFQVTNDDSKRINENLLDVQISLILAIILAVLVVYTFLHNLRGTFIVSMAIPISFVSTFLVMNSMGLTLNTMTLMALSLATGILVDDSIVVLENIFRHLSNGERPREAALNGRSEIGLAAVTITLVDVVVFVPIAFMGGIAGMFFKAFGITIAVATLFSLFVSFTLTPMLASRWFKGGEHLEEAKTGFFGWFERNYGKLEKGYRRLLDRVLTHRWITLGFGVCLLLTIFMLIAGSLAGKIEASKMGVSLLENFLILAVIILVVGFVRRAIWHQSVAPAIKGAIGLAVIGAIAYGGALIGGSMTHPLLPFRFFGQNDSGGVGVSVELPAGTSLATTDSVLKTLESRIKANKDLIRDVASISSIVGGTSSGMWSAGGTGSNVGEISLELAEKRALIDQLAFWRKHEYLRTRKDTDLVDITRKAVGSIPGAKITISASGGEGGGGAPIEIDLQGSNTNQLVTSATKIRQVLDRTEGCVDADVSWKLGKPELQFTLDQNRAADLGVNLATVATAVRTYIEGNTDVKYRDAGKEYDIRVQLPKDMRTDLDGVGDLVISYANGSPVRLADLGSVRLISGPTKIDRRDRERQVAVTCNLKPGYLPGNMQGVIDAAIAKAKVVPPGVRLAWSGENQLMAEEGTFMMRALMLAIILVYMLMASLFNSLLTPLIIMLSLPMALIGALVALIVCYNAGVDASVLNVVAFIGVIMLMGLVTKNAILMVDYTNTLRARGYERHEALLTAGPTRMRPILMTAFAAIFGTLPTALALGRGSEFRQPMGITVIGGLLLGTVLTLLVIPAVYTIFDDVGQWLSNLGHRKAKPKS